MAKPYDMRNVPPDDFEFLAICTALKLPESLIHHPDIHHVNFHPFYSCITILFGDAIKIDQSLIDEWLADKRIKREFNHIYNINIRP